jgi:TonB-dependent starch-binding outer membrane protein SusC
MRAVRTTLMSVVLVLCAAFLTEVAAQTTGTVTGRVTNEAGEPLIGAQIVVQGTNVGGLTNDEGRFLILRVPAGAHQVRAVLIGYGQSTQNVTVRAGEATTVDFRLSTSAVALGALVASAATGREQRTRELGASVGAIEVQDLNPAPITSVADVLGGRTEGVIMQDVNGTTGTSQRIRIRGANSLSLNNEPLVFIDGVRANAGFGGTFGVGGQQSSRLNDVNPNDIASIDILKGPAATALYGTAAANGVIQITTKRGRPGGTQWTAFVETGQIEDKVDYPANFAAFDIINPGAPQFTSAGFFNTVTTSNPGGYAIYCPNRLAALSPGDPGYCEQEGTMSYNTLMDSRTRPFETGLRQRYGMSVRGGTEQVRFFVSGQLEGEDGVISINEQDKVNFRANMDARLTETTDASVSFGYAQTQLSLNNNDNSIFSPILNGLVGLPYFVPAAPDAEFDPNPSNYGFSRSMQQLEVYPNLGDVDRYTVSTNLRFRPTSWLSFNGTGGLDLTSGHRYSTLQPNGPLGNLAASYMAGFRQSERYTNYLYSGTVSGTGTFQLMPDLLSNTTIGGSYNRDNTESTYCYGSGLVPGTASCGTVSNLFSLDEDFFEVRTVGGYLQQELAWRDRVFLAASLRGDDNSAFGTDFGFAYYPGVSLSWVIGDEEFFPQTDLLSTLRLRGAWGTSGLQPGFRSATTLFSPTTVATEGGDVPGVSLSVTGNTLLEPERTTEYEFGFDTGFFDERLSLQFTYFNKTSEDALISRRLPGSLGLTGSVLQNLGSIRNAGTELGLNLRVYESDRFALSLGANNTSLDNEVLELGQGVEDIIFNRGLQRHTEGRPAGAFILPEVTFNDTDGNGKLTIAGCEVGGDPTSGLPCEVFVSEDESYIGPSLPTWQRSFFADMRLFDFITISTLFEGRGGHYTGNDSEGFRCGFRSTFGCPAVGDPNASLHEQAAYLADRFLGSAYLYVEKADFYKWRELSVTLSTPDAWANHFRAIEGLRLTVAGRNLMTWTDYTGLDPETVEGGGNSNFSQSEFNTQPPVRYLMLRLDYSF